MRVVIRQQVHSGFRRLKRCCRLLACQRGGIRADAGLSQAGFARVLGLSVRTLQEWEQGRKHPSGPAQKLIELVGRHPECWWSWRLDPAPIAHKI